MSNHLSTKHITSIFIASLIPSGSLLGQPQRIFFWNLPFIRLWGKGANFSSNTWSSFQLRVWVNNCPLHVSCIFAIIRKLECVFSMNWAIKYSIRIPHLYYIFSTISILKPVNHLLSLLAECYNLISSFCTFQKGSHPYPPISHHYPTHVHNTLYLTFLIYTLLL